MESTKYRTKTLSYRLLNQKQKNYAVTRIRTWVASATTKSNNHYTITAIVPLLHSVLEQN